MEFHKFDAHQATEADWREVYEFVTVRYTADWPDMTPSTFDAFVDRWRTADVGTQPETMWLAREDGDLVATANYMLFLKESAHLALVNVGVHPAKRGRGIGTAFFREMLTHVRRDDRTRVTGPNVQAGLAEAWARRMGFESGLRFALQRIVLADVDPALWDVPVPDGYRLEAWTDSAPEEILESFARGRRAIEDAVSGDLTWMDPHWTPERVREIEAELAARGMESRVVAAVHEASGEVAGVTELSFRLTQPERGHQGDTSVVREHRGHGLGRAMKAAMLRRVRVECPELGDVSTQTADLQNMARINLEIGYQTVTEYLFVEADLGELEKHAAL